MPNTSIHLSPCNILQNNKLQPTEIYKESQQTAKLEFFCDEFLKISQSRYGLSTSADSIANLLAFFTKASDAIDSIKTQKIDVHSYGFVPIRHFVEHVITYKNEFAADYEPYTLTFTRGENNEGILSVESKEGFISQRTINLNEYETAINIINEHVIKENIHNTVQSPTEKDISKIALINLIKPAVRKVLKVNFTAIKKNIQTCYYILRKIQNGTNTHPPWNAMINSRILLRKLKIPTSKLYKRRKN